MVFFFFASDFVGLEEAQEGSGGVLLVSTTLQAEEGIDGVALFTIHLSTIRPTASPG